MQEFSTILADLEVQYWQACVYAVQDGAVAWISAFRNSQVLQGCVLNAQDPW